MFVRKGRPVSVASRLALKFLLLSTFTLTLASLFDIIPSPKHAEIRRKAVICESLAVTSSLLVQHQHDETLQKMFAATISRYPEILSACIRKQDGAVLLQIGDHDQHWHLEPNAPSTRENCYVPIKNGEQTWAAVEVSFAHDKGLFATLTEYPLVILGVFMVCVNGPLFRMYLSRTFKYLDPARSVPLHVRSTLDTFAEGVVVLDNDQKIVLANDKFRNYVGKTDHELLGHHIDELPWEGEAGSPGVRWQVVDSSSDGIRMQLARGDNRRTYFVNASAIMGDDGERRGTIASFDDITPLEEQREVLSSTLTALKSSRDELTKQNGELQYLATRDPLTGCLNRRMFFELFDKQWAGAKRHHHALSCFMLDIDHFKSVNDNHGHSTGDEVLRRVAQTIQETARESDVVCRFGGEEFCMLLPETDTESAQQVAERARRAVEELEFEKLSVTASFGVSSIDLGAADPQELLDQADKCLYIAKRGGRNQVVRWDEAPDTARDERENAEVSGVSPNDSSIPYPAVASLLSALAYRDAATAAHSTRVAEICVATASGLLSSKQTYVLETAALLHDIGKIGVPDAILLKPGALTPEEWEVMRLHDRIGPEILEASFSNQQFVDIVRFRDAAYGGSADAPNIPKGRDIPIGARIVSIADAYDAMVSGSVYRTGCPPEEAFKELRRCSGSQFDPELVEHFISVMEHYESILLPVTSKQVVLQFGLQIERLAEAVDDQDEVGIRALVARLETTAAHGGIREIETVAADIRKETDDEHDCDWLAVLTMVDELMTLCRSTQKSYADRRFCDEGVQRIEPCPPEKNSADR